MNKWYIKPNKSVSVAEVLDMVEWTNQRSITSFNEDKSGRIIVEAEHKPKDKGDIIWQEFPKET